MGAGNGEEMPKGAHAEQDGQVVRNGQAVHAHAGPHGQEGGEQNMRGAPPGAARARAGARGLHWRRSFGGCLGGSA